MLTILVSNLSTNFRPIKIERVKKNILNSIFWLLTHYFHLMNLNFSEKNEKSSKVEAYFSYKSWIKCTKKHFAEFSGTVEPWLLHSQKLHFPWFLHHILDTNFGFQAKLNPFFLHFLDFCIKILFTKLIKKSGFNCTNFGFHAYLNPVFCISWIFASNFWLPSWCKNQGSTVLNFEMSHSLENEHILWCIRSKMCSFARV